MPCAYRASDQLHPRVRSRVLAHAYLGPLGADIPQIGPRWPHTSPDQTTGEGNKKFVLSGVWTTGVKVTRFPRKGWCMDEAVPERTLK